MENDENLNINIEEDENLDEITSSLLIEIKPYTHQGKREYQEDSYAFSDRFILVSDGVGGLAKGENASSIIADIFSGFADVCELSPDIIVDGVEQTVDKALEALLDFATNNPESMGMGATLAMVMQCGGKLFSIHIGDSRIYQFGKDGSIRWKSKDHSLVQELVDAGIVKPEDAATHPRKNVITRVLQAKPEHKVKASVSLIEHIEEGDRFLVCSDGVTESWTDTGLSALFGSDLDNEKIKSEIQSYCSEHSSDNNTAIIAGIRTDLLVQEKIAEELSDNNLTINEPVIDDDSNPDTGKWHNKFRSFFRSLMFAIGIIAVFLVASRYSKKSKDQNIENQENLSKKTDRNNPPKRYSNEIIDIGNEDVENQFWQQVLKVNTDSAYNRYLSFFPDGKYSKKAKLNLEKIKKKNIEVTPKETTIKDFDGVIIKENTE